MGLEMPSSELMFFLTPTQLPAPRYMNTEKKKEEKEGSRTIEKREQVAWEERG